VDGHNVGLWPRYRHGLCRGWYRVEFTAGQQHRHRRCGRAGSRPAVRHAGSRL